MMTALAKKAFDCKYIGQLQNIIYIVSYLFGAEANLPEALRLLVRASRRKSCLFLPLLN